MTRIEGVHPTTVQRWVDRSSSQAKAADQEVITAVSTENVELDELYSFAGEKNPEEQESASKKSVNIGRTSPWRVNHV